MATSASGQGSSWYEDAVLRPSHPYNINAYNWKDGLNIEMKPIILKQGPGQIKETMFTQIYVAIWRHYSTTGEVRFRP